VPNVSTTLTSQGGVKERDLVSTKFITVQTERHALERECELLQRSLETSRKNAYTKDAKLRADFGEKYAEIEGRLKRAQGVGCDGTCKDKISELVHTVDGLRRQCDNAKRALDKCLPGGGKERVVVLAESQSRKSGDDFTMPGSFMRGRGASAIAAKTAVIVRKRKK
jgi:hypothetical protein